MDGERVMRHRRREGKNEHEKGKTAMEGKGREEKAAAQRTGQRYLSEPETSAVRHVEEQSSLF